MFRTGQSGMDAKKNPSAMPRGKAEGLCYFGIFD